jgi:hypothetical protein
VAATSFEEAKDCPKCGKPGEDMGGRVVAGGKRGSKTHTIYCRNELCPWLDTPYFVTRNPDGSIPEAKNHTGEPKLYQGFEGHDDMAKQLIDELKASEQAQLNPGTELRRRK